MEKLNINHTNNRLANSDTILIDWLYRSYRDKICELINPLDIGTCKIVSYTILNFILNTLGKKAKIDFNNIPKSVLLNTNSYLGIRFDELKHEINILNLPKINISDLNPPEIFEKYDAQKGGFHVKKLGSVIGNEYTSLMSIQSKGGTGNFYEHYKEAI